jgi:hypothetical protein
MPTQDVLIPIGFSQGLDTKTDSKSVLPGRLLNVENGIFTKNTIIEKRNGMTRLGTNVFGSGTIAAAPGAALNLFQDELTMCTGDRFYSRSENNDALIDRGTAISVQVANQQIQGATSRDFQRTTSIVNQSIGVYAWYDGSAIWIQARDEKSGAVFTQQNLSVGFVPTGAFSLFNSGNYVYIVYGTGGNLRCYQLAILVPNIITFVSTLVTDADAANPMLDIVEFGANAFAAYRNASATISMFFIIKGNVATISQGYPGIVTISETVNNCLSVLTDNVNVYVAWHTTSLGTRMQGFSYQLTSLFSTVTVDATTAPATMNITGLVSGTSVSLWYEVRSSIDVNQLIKTATVSNAGAITSAASVFRRSLGLAAKAFSYNGLGYIPCVFYSATQPTYFIYSSANNRVAKLVDDEAGGYQIQSFLSRVNVSSTNSKLFTFANLNKTQLTFLSGGLYFNRGVNRSSIEFGTNNAFAAAQLGQNLHVIGGSLLGYDGQSISEAGFDVYPEGQSLSASISTVSGSIGAGAAVNAGVYTYYFTYRWFDAQNQLHQSAPSLPQQIALTGTTNAVTWTIPTLRVTDKVSGSIAVYRSQQNSSPIVPYMLTALSGVLNDATTADTVTFIDTKSDAAIAGNSILYTVGPNGPGGAGSPVENDAPPACAAICTNKNRLWLIASENPYRLFYSKEFVPTNGVAFNLGFFVDVDPAGGPCTALASFYNNLIVFKESSIYLVSGDGPDATGNTDTGRFEVPQLQSSDVGCVNPASVVVTSQGVMFQSQKGIYLYTVGSAPVYIGAAVEKWNGYKITSATVLADRNEVRFTLADNGPTLVYNQFRGEWGTFTGLHSNLIDSIVYNGAYTVLSYNGRLYREDPATHQDDNQNTHLTLSTAWLKPSAILQGYQRVKKLHVLGNFESDHKLLVQVYFDYNDVAQQSYIFDPSTALNQSAWGSDSTWGSGSLWGSIDNQNSTDQVYQFTINLEHQKCEAIKVSFTDAFSGSLGAAYSLSELCLTVGLKKGAYKLPGGKRVGGSTI